VHDPLGDALMIEVLDLLAQNEIFQQRRAAPSALERVLIIADWRPVIGGQAALGS
jgi:hypothetical protein